MKLLGELEQVVMLGAAHLGEEAYGLAIRREIERRTGRKPSVGAIYSTLYRLEEKGLVRSWEGEPRARRGGRARRHFALTPSGVAALRATQRVLERMWEGAELGGGA